MNPSLLECILSPDQASLDSDGHPLDANGYRLDTAALEIKEQQQLQTGKYVVHLCGNRDCVNPLHLAADSHPTRLEGILNAKRPDTGAPKGEGNGNTDLTDDDVRLIVRLSEEGGLTQRQIAKQFGISQQAVSGILRGRTWAHITGK